MFNGDDMTSPTHLPVQGSPSSPALFR